MHCPSRLPSTRCLTTDAKAMLEPYKIYHFYNQGNNKERIFYQERNYEYFLSKVRYHIAANCNVLAYCLMPNHFHFLIYTQPSSIEKVQLGGLKLNKFTASIKHLQSGYARAINKQENRSGSLFRQKAKVKLVESKDKNYPFIAFHYIHQNPVKAGLVTKMEDWPYSSFNEYWNGLEGTCNKKLVREVIDFGDDDFYEQSYAVIY